MEQIDGKSLICCRFLQTIKLYRQNNFFVYNGERRGKLKYRNALLKICWTLILFIGLSISAAYAASGKTFTCPAGSRCNPVMEGWCLQHETILSQSLQGKTLKTLTTIYPLGPAVLTSVPNYYNYSSSINCSSKYCCFTSTVDKLIAAIGDVPDAIKKIAKKAKKYINPDEDPDTSDD